MQDQKDDPVPNQVHTYSTQLGTQILPAIGQCMALVLHLVDPEMVPNLNFANSQISWPNKFWWGWRWVEQF